jgi:hypothetical protein
MSMARDHWSLMVLLAIPHAVEFSVCIGVAGCGHPISARVVRSIVAFLQLSNSMPISASKADDKTGFMMDVEARMATFSMVLPMSADPM